MNMRQLEETLDDIRLRTRDDDIYDLVGCIHYISRRVEVLEPSEKMDKETFQEYIREEYQKGYIQGVKDSCDNLSLGVKIWM